MKIREGFILRKIANTDIVIPVGNNIADFNGVISLNETGAYLWRQLMTDTDIAALAEAMAGEFEINKELAQKDTEQFILQLKQANLLEGCV